MSVLWLNEYTVGIIKMINLAFPPFFSLPFMIQFDSLDLLASRSSSCDVQIPDNIVYIFVAANQQATAAVAFLGIEYS